MNNKTAAARRVLYRKRVWVGYALLLWMVAVGCNAQTVNCSDQAINDPVPRGGVLEQRKLMI